MSILASFPRCLVFTAWFCVCLLSGAVWSAELGQAKVSAILRDVQKTEGSKTEPAAVGDVIAGGGRITTQGQSLAELKFPDGSVIRIGNNSTFSFDPNDRTVRLDRGTALVSTPPKAEGINIVSGGVSGTVGGDPAGKTFLVTAYSAESGGAKGAPTGGFGLMVLQGSSATTVSAPSGSVSIAPGQFALVGGKMDGAPKVLTVDVGQVFRSSPLVNSFPEPLPTKGAILSTAIQQQGSQSSGGLRSTGTSGVALTSGGDLLTGGSKPAKSGGYTFEIASNVPGTGRQEKQATATEKNKDDSGLDIATAAGGPTGSGGIVGAVTGSTGGGSRAGGGGVNIPSVPSIPANTGQSGITANPNNPNNQNNRNNLPATVVNAQVQSKTYDGLVSAMIQNALLSGIQSGDSVALQNDTTGIFANKNVGTWRVSTTMGLTGADAGRYILTQPTMSGTITAKDVTIATGTAFGKVYDGNTGATVTAGGLSGLVAGEILGISTAVGTFAIKDVGTRNVTAAYTLTDGANLASNYNLINPTETLTATITAKALTMTGSSAASKVYDGNRSASLTLGTLSGEVAGETLGTSTVVGTFNSKDVLSANTVTAVYTLVDGANGELASNYSLANASLASTITAKSLSITAPSIGSKTYDGLATAGSLTLGTLSGFVGSETVRATGTAADFSSANVGSYSSVVTYNLADGLNGGLASNYSLAAGSASGAITAKGLSITAPAIASKVYNGNATAGSLTLGTLSGFVGSETVTASGAAADYSSANVGTYNGVVVSYTLGNGSNGGLDSNYSLAAGSATGVITAKDVTIASGSVSGKVYDGNTGAVVTAGSLSGLVNGESLGTTMASGTFVSKDVGTRNVAATYTLTDGANLASNYNLINPTETLSATITAKVLTMTGSTATSKVYDGNTTASVTLGTLSGEVLGETLGFSTVVGTFNSKDVLAANTVTAVYTLTDGLNGELASNYSLVNDSLASTITAKVLTISVATPSTVTSKVYDGSAAASVTVGALVGEVAGETLGATTAVGTFADKNIGTKNVAAVYTLVDGANGELVSNYSLAAETLTGTITAKDLSVFNAAVTTKVYDGNDAAVVTGAVLVGNSTLDNDGKFIGTETVTLSGGTTGTFASKNVGAGQTVTTTMNLGGSDAGNYTLNTQPTLSGTITAKALTMTGSSAASKVYDGNTTASVTLGTLSGEVVGETLGTSTVVGTFNSKDVLAANTVTAVYTLVDGANGELASNYSLANDSLASTITAKALTMTGSTAATKVYDGNRTASVTLGALSGEVVGETLGTSTAVGTFNSKDVLAANTVTAVYTLTDGLNGELASNYSLANDSLASTITAKALTMTGSTAASKVYDGNTTASVTLGTLSGEVVGETLG
ncbi:MAG: hypothetical protein EBT07_09035, partial [Actinobacteria bacterium]|nr:hypothetical protein [Actinomycetota bacterium]